MICKIVAFDQQCFIYLDTYLSEQIMQYTVFIGYPFDCTWLFIVRFFGSNMQIHKSKNPTYEIMFTGINFEMYVLRERLLRIKLSKITIFYAHINIFCTEKFKILLTEERGFLMR